LQRLELVTSRPQDQKADTETLDHRSNHKTKYLGFNIFT
jgi:hypothetical protein